MNIIGFSNQKKKSHGGVKFKHVIYQGIGFILRYTKTFCENEVLIPRQPIILVNNRV